jgi:hypothetical protein
VIAKPLGPFGSLAGSRPVKMMDRLPAGRTTLAWRAAAVGLWPGFINGERPPARAGSVQRVDGPVSLSGVPHFDESEAPRSPSLSVRHEPDTLHGSEWFKERTDRFFGGAEIQVAHEYVLQVGLLVI